MCMSYCDVLVKRTSKPTGYPLKIGLIKAEWLSSLLAPTLTVFDVETVLHY